MRQSPDPGRECTIQVSFLEARARDEFEMHSRHSHSIVCVNGGPAVLELAGSQLNLEAGSLVLIGNQTCKGVLGWHLQSGQAAVLAFCRDMVVDGASTTESIEYLRAFETQIDSTPQVVAPAPEVIEEIVDLMRRITRESASRGAQSGLAMKTYLKMILVLIGQQTSGAGSTLGPHPRELTRLEPLLNYLAEHYMDTIQVDQAAQLLNMSNSHFMRYFRHATGSAFVPYLNRLRISKAQQLLGQNRLSITEVGESVGFCDHSYFSAVFRRFSGMGPRDYRKALYKDLTSA